MKIKTLIACLGAFITLISGVGFNTLNNQKEVSQNENIIIADVVDSENNNDLNENLVIDLEEQNKEIVNTEEQNDKETQETTKTEDNQVNEIKNDLPKKSENNYQNKGTTSVKTNTEVKQEVKQPEIKQEQPKQETKSENVEKKKTEEKITKEPTPSYLGYWCAEGGTHHVAGDGANEHGYYSSWNEAQNAFENYTKGWPSVQYKISQCLCGKYYFWAIQ